MLREAGVTLIRWPGGNFASQYHWVDGIGPMEYRPIRLNRAWNIPEYNRVGTDEFMMFAKLVGAEPLIVVNAGWDGTIDEAAAWVEYVNGDVDTTWGRRRAENGNPEPYGVVWWELGNELYGSWQIGHMTAPQYAKRYEDLYNAMKAVDPNIRFIANGGLDNAGEDHWSWLQWDHYLLERNKGRVEYVSRHYLIWVDMSEPDYYKAIGWTFAIRERWKEMQEILRRYQDPPPRLAITEAQGARDLDVSTTMIEALWVAGLYNSAIYSDGFVEIITRSSLMWFGGGLRKSCEIVYPTPAYYVHKIYATQPGKYPVLVRVITPTFESGSRLPEIPAASDVPYVDAVALFNEDRSTLSLIIVNYHTTNNIKTYINLHNYEIDGPIKVVQLTAPAISARNTWNNPDYVKPVEYIMEAMSNNLEIELPKLSVTLLLINGSVKPGSAPDPYKAVFTLPVTISQTTTPISTEPAPSPTTTSTPITPVSTPLITPTPTPTPGPITTTPVQSPTTPPITTPVLTTPTTPALSPTPSIPIMYLAIPIALLVTAISLFILLRKMKK
ncbi:MAG: alpha-L-arabinofuranosidase C-terminal domain-containing protein [Desulfurococcaceae archaeon]